VICPSCRSTNDESADVCFKCGKGLFALTEGAVLASRYEILEPLGRGGMGMVYKAHDRELDETVAVKVLRGDLARSSVIAQRFRSEIKLARRVRHKNVCGIHEYGQEGDVRFISMEFVDGVDLRRILGQGGALPAAEAFEVSIQVADGLNAIHEEAIIHRDLKTPNIMRDRRGVVRLMDFGIAKQSEAESAHMTATGQIIGTPEYMSPEQIRGQKIDFRSDIYALGIVLFEIFTGDVPFRGDTPMVTLFKHLQDPPPLDGPEAVRLPGALVPVIRKALAKEPADRYASARELAEALREARAASGMQAHPASTARRPILTATVPKEEPAPVAEPTQATTYAPTKEAAPLPADSTEATHSATAAHTAQHTAVPTAAPTGVGTGVFTPRAEPGHEDVVAAEARRSETERRAPPAIAQPTPTPVAHAATLPPRAPEPAAPAGERPREAPASRSPVASSAPSVSERQRPAWLRAVPAAVVVVGAILLFRERTATDGEKASTSGPPVTQPAPPASTRPPAAAAAAPSPSLVSTPAAGSPGVAPRPFEMTTTVVPSSPSPAKGRPALRSPATPSPEAVAPRPPAAAPATARPALPLRPEIPTPSAATKPTPSTPPPISRPEETPPPEEAPSIAGAVRPRSAEATSSTPSIGPTPPAPEAPGTLVLNVKPWAEVTLDGRPVGRSPRKIPLTPGPHTLLLNHPDFEPFRRVVTMRSGGILTLTVDLKDEAVRRKR
jgi:eukaryotic-like serine/threonine-protein kinase